MIDRAVPVRTWSADPELAHITPFWVAPKMAAHLYGVNENTLHQWITEGVIVGTRPKPRVTRILLASIERYYAKYVTDEISRADMLSFTDWVEKYRLTALDQQPSTPPLKAAA